tara:strand:+ start:238630 stop:239658 length:1029 start_codon:yes stop_codon:yes gene_type:complete
MERVILPISPEKIDAKSLSNRFWGSEPKRNAFKRAKNIVLSGVLDTHEIQLVKSEYNGDLNSEYSYEWKQLLEEIAYAIALDGKIETFEREFIRTYRKLFDIEKTDAAAIYKRGATRAYIDLVVNSLGHGDHGLTDELMSRMESISKEIGIKSDDAKEILVKQLTELISNRLNGSLNDGMISDVEWKMYEDYRISLRLGALYSESDRLAIDAARTRWHCEYGTLCPIVLSTHCKLKGKETPYFEGVAQWFETRSRSGVQELSLIAVGTLILTDQRVILLADEGDNKTVMWSGLYQVTRHDAKTFELEKTRGKSPLIKIYGGDPVLLISGSAIAARLFDQNVK